MIHKKKNKNDFDNKYTTEELLYKIYKNQIEILAHIRLFTVIILVLIMVQFFVQ